MRWKSYISFLVLLFNFLHVLQSRKSKVNFLIEVVVIRYNRSDIKIIFISGGFELFIGDRLGCLLSR